MASTPVIELKLLIIFLAGIFQALFGVLRLGNLIRYIPSPVMAGFQNAAAVLIFLSQLAPMLGVPRQLPALQTTRPRTIGGILGAALGPSQMTRQVTTPTTQVSSWASEGCSMT